ncbi:hypothetical protein AB0A74_12565 [Saccharothrix sp. NPDC042600]|uniref:hypothetical protein n=1 Tax=Saccharothrix TaxID=2071 RepID=UPI0033C725BE|nr:hypothetical protein GCM10017745_84420 [Saccharothrix mutabilis subsp. capreolus]
MDVIKTSDLKAAGMPRYKIDLRCRPGGPWQRVMPGVLLLGAAPPTRAERVRAALAYAGPEAVLTGVDALHAQGFPELPLPPRVHVLQPAGRRRSGDHHVLLERTTRLPRPVVKDGLPLAPPVRAVLDAARAEPHPARTRALLAAVLRSGVCTTPALLAELDAGSTRGTATPRAVLHALSRPSTPTR